MKKLGIYRSLQSGKLFAALTDPAFEGHEGETFDGGVDGESESILIRLAEDDEHLPLAKIGTEPTQAGGW